MARNLSIYHSYIYVGGLMLLGASLAISPFLVSLAQIILLLNWLLEGQLKTRLWEAWHRKTVFFFLLIFIVHILWLIPTQDFAYAFRDLRIKLPLLLLPLIAGTSRSLRENELKMILVAFIAGVLASSIVSTYRLSTSSVQMADIRNISVFISHIRLSLLVNIAIFSILYLLITGSFQWQRIIRNTLWASLAWFMLFLFILQSITGLIIFIITGMLFLFKFSSVFEKRYWYIRYPLQYGLSAFVLIFSVYSIFVMFSFLKKPVDESNLRSHTESGAEYVHYLSNRQVENGNYVWINICEPELQREWNRKSSIDYHGQDLKGHELRYTLIRYLASLGLDKDAEGMAQLTETDIINIERGMANHIYQNYKWLYPRIYQIIWEVDNYRKGGNPSGHSFAQRIEYWKAGFGIIRNNFLFGTGTGDVALAYKNYYAENESRLAPEWQLRAHNQFLTFFVSFGLAGFLVVLFGMISPLIIEKRIWQILPFTFICIALLSMLTEDTLETQAGATFFAFFYALFIFAHEKVEEHPDQGDQPPLTES
jgi:hypothetical protein